MCGINGIFAHHNAANPIDRTELRRTRDHMAGRGPDGWGEWMSDDGRMGFGHRRLSIIDLTEAAAQPMASSDGRFVVTFNGEIYNHQALRRNLEAKGYKFRSNSDTEVLLHLYADKGEAMVYELRGMFAYALFDVRKRTLFLARDPYGIKPLYYSDDGWTFRFASQVQALMAGRAISRDGEPAGLVGFCLWGSVPEPFTTYRSVRSLPAGCHLTVDQVGASEPRRYHSIAQVYCDAEVRDRNTRFQRQSASKLIRGALLDSVRHHLLADVPVGAFLSAGIDSGALVGLMRDVSDAEIKTVTIAFEEFRGQIEDEAPLAAEVARAYGTQHQTRVITEREFRAELPKIFAAMDQPSIDGLNTWFVSKAAKELGLKVAISGLGGDELFGGYPSFKDIPRWVARLSATTRVPWLGKAIRHLLSASGLDGLISSPKAAGLLELGGSFAGAYMLRRGLYMPWELNRVLDGDTVRQGLAALRPLDSVRAAMTPSPVTAFAKVATLESSLYMRNQLLRDTDWASMAHGLEVRVPLVDSILLEQIAELGQSPSDTTAKAHLALAPRKALPDAVVGRSKTGFGMPVGAWISPDRGGLRSNGGRPHRSKALDARNWSKRVMAEGTK
jgi:asparagine synthase (glutamine-hydrolysing)